MSYPSKFTIPEPPQDFIQWWEPYMIDPESGAHVGGHPDARRIWARKDEHGWVRRTYGTPARTAYATSIYAGEYDAWRAIGSPRRLKDFVSIAAPYEKQQQFWHELQKELVK